MLLILRRHAAENLIALLLGGLLDIHRLESSLQRRIPFNMLPVLVESRRPDDLELPPGKGRFQDICGVQRALRTARADDRVDLIDKEQGSSVVFRLRYDSLDPLLELSAVLGPRHHGRDIEGQKALPRDGIRHPPGDDPLRDSLRHRCLSDAGLTDQAGIILRPPGQDLDDPHDLRLSPDDGIETVLSRKRREVAGVLVQHRGTALLPLIPLPSLLLRSAESRADRIEDLLVHVLDIAAQSRDNAGRGGARLLQDGDQDMLCPHKLRAAPVRLLNRGVQNPSGRGRVAGAVRHRDIAVRGQKTGDHIQNLLLLDPVRGENLRGERRALPAEPEKDMLRSDIVVVQALRSLNGKLQRSLRLYGELIHSLSFVRL